MLRFALPQRGIFLPSQSRCARQLVLPLSLTRHLPPTGGSLSKGEAIAAYGQLLLNLGDALAPPKGELIAAHDQLLLNLG